jgi:hypothetical protein
MRVTSVDVYSANVEEPISFSLRGSDPHAQYQVRNIVGLDAEEIIQKFYGFSNSGDKYYNFGLKPRDIVMRIALNPKLILGETPSDVRDRLYRAIASNRTGGLRLHFKSGATTVSSISGYISKFEVGYFNKLPEVQLTVRCGDPMFRAINPVVFDEEDLTVNPLNIPDTLSTAPHGFVMMGTFTDDSASLTIQDAETDPEWVFQVSPYGGFESGDQFYMSSEISNKQIYLNREGSILHLADAIEPLSIWPIIFPFPSVNNFYIEEFDKITLTSLTYYAAYWGA